MAGNEDPRCAAIRQAFAQEPYARKLGMVCEEVRVGYCRLAMTVGEDQLNLFGTTHGGAVFSLADGAFQVACNSSGITSFALNVSVTYLNASGPGDRLVATAGQVAETRRTSTFELRVTRDDGTLIAVGQALAYRKGGTPPFLEEAQFEGPPAQV